MEQDKDTTGQPPVVSEREIIARLRDDLDIAEKELSDSRRMIALLVIQAGGKVSLSRRAIAEVSEDTVIETMQDVVNGGWVVRARSPRG